jgi:uncharacterized protein (TIGR02453 family)
MAEIVACGVCRARRSPRRYIGPMARKPHFTTALFAFLGELRLHNNREWFERNKEQYLRNVRDPMLRFISDFAPVLRKIAPCLIADPRPVGGSLFRLHRDTRFSSDKAPYKTNVSGSPVVRRQIVRRPYWPSSADSPRESASIAAHAGPMPPTSDAASRAGSGVWIMMTPDRFSTIRRAAARAVMR